jgi:transposase
VNLISAGLSYAHLFSNGTMKFKLTGKERRHLDGLVRETKDKQEYARGTGMLMKWTGKKAEDVARELNVCMGAVFKVGASLQEGTKRPEKQEAPGRPPRQGREGERVHPRDNEEDPQAFGFLKGRWVVRDISKALKEEGVEISPTHVHGVLDDLGLSYKRPKLMVESNDPSFARKGRSG